VSSVSFLRPEHEERARAIIAEEIPGCAVSLSSDVVPQIREYYLLSTTVINAYLEPILARYIGNLEQRLSGAERDHAAEIHHAIQRRHGDLLGQRQKKQSRQYCLAPRVALRRVCRPAARQG
jgi:N-methylhydantoinase A/oxoprolinase/acetone carboxylase beta subunit